MTNIKELIKRMRQLEQDHEPEGWPAVQMKDITALCDEIERLHINEKLAWNVAGKQQNAIDELNDEIEHLQRQKDIDLEDHFAGLAMQTAFKKAIHNWKQDGEESLSIDWSFIAQSAYEATDAMMEVRKQRMEND